MKRPNFGIIITVLIILILLGGSIAFEKELHETQTALDQSALSQFAKSHPIIFSVLLCVTLCVLMLFIVLVGGRSALMERLRFGKELNIKTLPAADMTKSSIRIVSGRPQEKVKSVEFLTEKVNMHPILEPSMSDMPSILESSCDKAESSKQSFFEIQVYFSLYNGLQIPISVFDMHARLYHASAGRLLQPASIFDVERYRVELYSDNSILRDGRIYRASPKDVCYFMLAFEASFYDEANNAMAVFGIDIEYSSFAEDGQANKHRVSSDCIYILQYIDNTPRIKELDRKRIDIGLNDESKAKRTLYKSLDAVYKKHISRV